MTEPPLNQESSGAIQGKAEDHGLPIVESETDTIPKPPSPQLQNSTLRKKRCWPPHDPPMFWVSLAGVIAVVAYTSVAAWQACLTQRQLNEMKTASGLMKDQLDVMETDKRPWIESKVSIVDPIIFTEWAGHKGINLKLKFDLKNHGQVPAINLKTWTVITPHPGNDKRSKIDALQQSACDSVRKQADENSISGIAVFLGESTSVQSGTGAMGDYDKADPILFSVYGCIDYTYGNARHGQTGFRMILGKVEKNLIVGLPFVEGSISERDYAPSPELLAEGYPPRAPKHGFLQSEGVIFRPDDGGNYAK
jgi:hypothetical protein